MEKQRNAWWVIDKFYFGPAIALVINSIIVIFPLWADYPLIWSLFFIVEISLFTFLIKSVRRILGIIRNGEKTTARIDHIRNTYISQYYVEFSFEVNGKKIYGKKGLSNEDINNDLSININYLTLKDEVIYCVMGSQYPLDIATDISHKR